MKLRILLWVAVAASLFTACQKEVDFQDLNNPGGNPGGAGGNTDIVLTGNWNFISLGAKVSATIIASQAGQELKAVVLNDYATIPATVAGSLTVTSDQFKFIGIGHTVSGTLTSQTYLSGILIDNSTQPIEEETPPSDETLDYVRYSNDSVTFTNGMAMLPDPTGTGGVTPTPTGPLGGKLSLSGDTLSLLVKYDLSQDTNQGGIPAQMVFKAESIMRFKRQ